MNTVVQILDNLEAEQGVRTDGQLLDRFVRLRDQDAFACVVRRHGPMVLAVCRRVLRNSADADDAFQAAFLVLARRAAHIAGRDQLAPWLHGVALNTARKLLRTNTRRAVREQPLEAAPEPAVVLDEVRDELLAILDEELGRLPERYREVVVLCDLEGLTRREAAQRLACPEGTVAGRLARARDLLAARLRGRGITSAAAVLVAVLTERAATALPPTAVSAVVHAIGVDSLAHATARGLISPRVADTTEGVLKSMFASKLRTTVAAVMCCGLALASITSAFYSANAQPDPFGGGTKIDPAPKPPQKTNADPFGGGGGGRSVPKLPVKPAVENKLLTAIPLKKLEAKPTAEKLAKLLPDAVTVFAARDENTLLVYATAKGTDDVRLVLRTLGEELPKETAKPDEPKTPTEKEPKKYTFGFRNTNWDEVLDWYAKESGLTLVATVKPTGKVTIWPSQDRRYTLTEITDLINEALAQQKLILVRRKLTFFLHPADEKVDPLDYTRVELADLKNYGKSELVEVSIPLRTLNAPDIAPELRKLLTPFGSVASLRGKILVVRDTVGSVERVIEALGTLEKPDPKAKPDTGTDKGSDPLKPGTKKVTMKFDKMPWKEVVLWYAKEFDLPIAIDKLPPGTFTFASEKPGQQYTLPEVTDIINEALIAQKWLLIRGPSKVVIVPTDEKINSLLVPRVTIEELAERGRTELVRVSITAGNVPLSELAATIRKLTGPLGEVAEINRTGVIEVRDLAGNVQRILKAIREPDDPEAKPAPPAPKGKTYSVKFEKTPWKDVFTWYAAESGLKQVGTELPKGTFTLLPQKVLDITPLPMYTLDEITERINEALNEALVPQKWLLVRGEKEFAVVPGYEEVDSEFVTKISRDDLNKHGKYALVEVTLGFDTARASDYAALVRKRLSAFGEVRVLPKSNELVVRELAGNLRETFKLYPELLRNKPKEPEPAKP